MRTLNCRLELNLRDCWDLIEALEEITLVGVFQKWFKASWEMNYWFVLKHVSLQTQHNYSFPEYRPKALCQQWLTGIVGLLHTLRISENSLTLYVSLPEYSKHTWYTYIILLETPNISRHRIAFQTQECVESTLSYCPHPPHILAKQSRPSHTHRHAFSTLNVIISSNKLRRTIWSAQTTRTSFQNVNIIKMHLAFYKSLSTLCMQH